MEDKPTAFERQTAAAFLYFFREGCEYAVIECGLGGLTDATNAICGKAMAVITSVSLDITAVLGNTLTEIARHKAGIIRGCPAVISQCVPQEVRPIFTASARGFQTTRNKSMKPKMALTSPAAATDFLRQCTAAASHTTRLRR